MYELSSLQVKGVFHRCEKGLSIKFGCLCSRTAKKNKKNKKLSFFKTYFLSLKQMPVALILLHIMQWFFQMKCPNTLIWYLPQFFQVGHSHSMLTLKLHEKHVDYYIQYIQPAMYNYKIIVYTWFDTMWV